MSGKDFPMPARDDIRLMDVLKALADPGRMQMLQILADGEYHSCSVEAFPIGVQKSTLSHHFKTLREAGVTETLVSGRNWGVHLRASDLETRFPGLLESLTSSAAARDVERTEDESTADD